MFADICDITPAFVKEFADPEQAIPPIGEVGTGVQMRIVGTRDPRPVSLFVGYRSTTTSR